MIAMQFVRRTAVAVFIGAAATAATAQVFSGNIAFHNDVVQQGFTLASDASNVRLWTDSYQSGVNFDPVMALFALPAGALIGLRDDDDSLVLAPGQTSRDSGFFFSTLAAGSYVFTVTTYNNAPVGDTLAQGFDFDGESPIALADWCQPGSDCSTQKGTFWRVNLATDTAPVPEPSSVALLALGLGATAVALRRRRV